MTIQWVSKDKKVYSLEILEVRIPQTRCSQVLLSLETLEENLHLVHLLE
jgi:hypothetical protein